MVAWLSRPKLPRLTLIFMFAVVALVCGYLEVTGTSDLLRNANVAFANVAICALALATLWPYSVPSPKKIGNHRAAIVTQVAHHLLFVGYFCAFGHYVCSFVLLADSAYLHFVKTHPLGVIVAIFASLFVIVLSVQCVSADSKVKSFAIKINGIILLWFTLHLTLLNYEAFVAVENRAFPPEVKVSISSFLVCVACLGFYANATVGRIRRARFAARSTSG